MKPSLIIALVLPALVALGCGQAPVATGLQGGVTAHRLTKKPGAPAKADFTGLKVTAIESLPVRCPCFELVAEHKGTRYEVTFETGFPGPGGDVSVRNVKLELPSGSHKAFGKALLLAADKVAKKDHAAMVEAVAIEILSRK